MQIEIRPASGLDGSLQLPGDKSISHRYAMLAGAAEGESTIRNYSSGADCHSTLACLRALGVEVHVDGAEVRIGGRGLRGWKEPGEALDAGNSGSTIRMMSGLLAAQPFRTVIAGDESLSRRPMGRIMKPLAEMGAKIVARDGQFPPLEISGGALQAIDYTLPMASAQVKTCVLFAGLQAEGITVVRESVRTRDHSEIALREFGAEVDVRPGVISIEGGHALRGRELTVPGDLSSAAFFLVGAMIRPESNLIVRAVGLNPTRSALLDFLVSAGGEVKVLELQQQGGELVGDILVRSSRPRGGVIEKALTAALIDEIPVLAVLGAMSSGGLVVRDAGELRVKETDRIATVADNFARMGVKVDVRPDGFEVPGNQTFHAAELDSFGDHRIAMSAAIAALAADGPCVIGGAEAASVSYPEFWDTLRRVTE
ncbi:MAG: 3-phosphoshikimate 1-carboxyvinyltransferase [Bryobacteraceae bacterium]|nr:3-phosphoshikimate 1-carboxyvinyltransferase [Bryobacteraceae bacterium]